MKKVELLPCPHCGGEGLMGESPVSGRDEMQYSIRCRSCACEGGWGKSKTGAIRWWNMRTPLKE
jgi:Lar family restriction alleviation protein